MTQPANEKAMWTRNLSLAPYDAPLLLACGGVLVGHRAKECAGFEFVDVSGAYCRPDAWMLAPELPSTAAPRALPADDVGEKPMPLHRRLEWKAVADHFKALNEQLESENARLAAALAEERDHFKCQISTGIDRSTTAGQGKLDENGFWELPCDLCAARAEVTVLRLALAEERAKGERLAAEMKAMRDAHREELRDAQGRSWMEATS